MENMEINQPQLWKNKTVLVTGQTGFKGTWLTMMLLQLGAKVIGISEPNPVIENFFYGQMDLKKHIQSGQLTEIRQDLALGLNLKSSVDFVFHLAAQSVVGESYQNPVKTYQSNVMGSVYLLDWIQKQSIPPLVLYITTDKVYQKSVNSLYDEKHPLGGFQDPYSTSKACADLIAQSYYESFYRSRNIRMAVLRSGNVIGGGDDRNHRLVPDVMRHLFLKTPIEIRTAQAVRPWQSVFEVLKGYLNVATYLSNRTPDLKVFNLGPSPEDHWTVEQILNYLNQIDQSNGWMDIKYINNQRTVDASPLFLNSDQIQTELNIQFRPHLQKTLDETYKWYQTYYNRPGDIARVSQELIQQHVPV